jgi:hypothetical protein
MEMGRKDGLDNNPLTKREMALQKKGIGNLSAAELREWIHACEKMEDWARGTMGSELD